MPNATPPAKEAANEREAAPEKQGTAVPATTMGRLAWHHLVHGGWEEIADYALSWAERHAVSLAEGVA